MTDEKVRPEDNLTVKPLKMLATPVLTLLSLTEDGDFIYIDQHWVQAAAKYGIEEMQVDLFQRHYDFEPGDSDCWVSSNMMPDPVEFWGMGKCPIFYFVIPTEVRRFEQFCRGYAVVMPGGDIMMPIILDPEAALKEGISGKLAATFEEIVKNGEGRIRFILAAILEKDTPRWVEYREKNKIALERRGHV